MGEHLQRIELVLAALADPTRRQVLDAIAAHGEATATTIAAELPVSRQAVVKHLAVLGRAGLVRGRRQGREMRYVVTPRPLDATAQWIADLAAAWDHRLARIKHLAESPDTPHVPPEAVGHSESRLPSPVEPGQGEVSGSP